MADDILRDDPTPAQTRLKDYPPKFNTDEIIFLTTWTETFSVVEDVMQSEAGTDLVNIVRKGKLTVDASSRVSSTWAKFFQEYSDEDSFTLHRYDQVTEGYKSHTVRMRNFSADKVTHSEDLSGSVTYGLYDISFTLEEF